MPEEDARLPQVTIEDDDDEKVLMQWTSVSRPFKERSKEFFSTVLVLAVLVGIIFFFIEGVMPVLVVAAVTFVIFALYKTQPDEVEHVLTNARVMTGTSSFFWDELQMYWFTSKWGREVLHILTYKAFPAELIMVLPEGITEEDKKKLRKMIGGFIPYQEPAKSITDKTVEWIGRKIPLEE